MDTDTHTHFQVISRVSGEDLSNPDQQQPHFRRRVASNPTTHNSIHIITTTGIDTTNTFVPSHAYARIDICEPSARSAALRVTLIYIARGCAAGAREAGDTQVCHGMRHNSRCRDSAR